MCGDVSGLSNEASVLLERCMYPSDDLYNFDFVDDKSKRLELTHHLVGAHNAHHRFDDICREYQRTVKDMR